MKLSKYKINFSLAESGFTIAESLISLAFITIMLVALTPSFMQQREENVKGEVMTGAVSLSKQILDVQRRTENLTLGRRSLAQLSNSSEFINPNNPSQSTLNLNRFQRPYIGFIYICTQPPTFISNDVNDSEGDDDVVCNTTVQQNSGIRYILLQIRYQEQFYGDKKDLYRVETAFTQLR